MSKTLRRGSMRAAVMLLALVCGLALNLGQLPLAHAAGVTTLVTSTADSGPGSLRQAIANAAPGDTILLSTPPGSVLTLASQLEISKNLTIQGPNANVLTISGNNATRVFQIDAGANVTISQLTIANGNASAAPKSQAGGGILNQGTLTLQYAVIRDSTSLEGGAIQNDGPNSNLTLTASTLVNNNSATVGGGIRNEGIATVTNSTITGNTATTAGGGISNNSKLTLTFNTITNNRITGSGTGSEAGGGIVVVQTFTPGQIVTTLQGNIVAGNSSGPTGRGEDVFGFVTSQGYNLIGNNVFAKGLPGGPGDQVGTPTAPIDPKLGTLVISAGSTPTLLPQPGSPAIDAGGTSCPVNDQRFSSRPQGTACDIGAVEFNRFDRNQVLTNADSGPGSLRQILNDLPADDPTIFFGQVLGGQTITLASQLEIKKNVGIYGFNAARLTISGNNATRIFQIDTGVTAKIYGVTIAHGNAHGNGLVQTGGGILNKGALTLLNSVIRDSNSAEGGGIQNDGPNSTLVITGSTLLNNATDTDGGGLRNEGTATVTNSTITGNTAVTSGGGVSNSGHLTISFSTITNNRITGSGTGSEAGGGISVVQSFTPGQVTTTLGGSIVAGNSAGATGKGEDVFNFVTSQGYNLIGNNVFAKGLPGGPGDQVGTPTAPLDPKLGTLDTSGLYPTPTFLPQSGSPAIDKGGPACPASDQRGSMRPQGAACDSGAVEVPQKALPITITPAALPSGSTGTKYNQQLSAIGGVTPYQFALISGTLPNGLTLSASGLLSGTPATGGLSSFMVKATDAKGASTTQNYILTVAPAQSTVAPPTQPVQPLLDCVADTGGGKFTALFGYRNSNTVPVTITVGANNFFTPAPQDQGQTTVFLPGRQHRVFNITFTGTSLVWTIIGPDGATRTATASSASRSCNKAVTVTLLQQQQARVVRVQDSTNPQLILDWENDADDVGVTYNLLRATSPNGPWTQVNDARLIPAGGQCPAMDDPGTGMFYYTVENIDPDGETAWFDPVPVTVGGAAAAPTGHSIYLPLTQR